MLCSRMAVKRSGMLGVSPRKMKPLTVMMDTVTLTDKGGLKSNILRVLSDLN